MREFISVDDLETFERMAQICKWPNETNTIPRDLAECKLETMRMGDWRQDTWDASTLTGQKAK